MRRQARRKRLSMTSLIDVIFLLLLFFMLSSTFTRFGEIDLTSASGGGAGASGNAPLFLQVSTQSLGLNGREIGLDALPGALNEGKPVLVSLRPDVSSQRLVDVLVTLKSVPNLSVTVLEGT
ncbi:biopolymer transporter ExbD [Donghicola sp. XS_ASV15]|uniref:biopolymer transporter ExbD n=1 Tax=Donghicola sp. XS_ASV15 TaxID=3241295 RepID=UPI003518274C